MTGTGMWGEVKTLLRRPSLLWEAVRSALAMTRRSGLGISSDYLEWRMYTAYGSHNARIEGDDLVHYLMWRRQMRRLAAWEGST